MFSLLASITAGADANRYRVVDAIPDKTEIARRFHQRIDNGAAGARFGGNQQDAKFVAAEARKGVVFPNTRTQHASQRVQQFVPGDMAERIVDDFKLIDIDIAQHRRRAAQLGIVERRPAAVFKRVAIQ